jgi:hypothetical protein
MNLIYKTTKEILIEFIDRAKFDIVAVQHNFLLRLEGTVDFLNPVEIVESLGTSAIFGKKCIAFMDKLPYYKIKNLLSGTFIIVSTKIPDDITIPTLFCKNTEQLGYFLETAYEISLDTRLPINIVLSETSVINFAKEYSFAIDNQQSRQNITKSNLTQAEEYVIEEKLSLAEAILSNKMPNNLEQKILSFKFEGSFFNYIIPHLKPPFKHQIYNAYDMEIKEFANIIGKLGITCEVIKYNDSINDIKTRPSLCPGCPFVSIFSEMNLKEYFVFSDINCKSIYEIFDIIPLKINEFYGILISEVKQNFLFITNYSSFSQKYLKNVNIDGKVILLKDTDIDREFFKFIKYPFKISKANFIFPYSCDNIASYKIPKLKLEKCTCAANSKIPVCIDNTYCPALKIKGGKIDIDSSFCTGCRACVSYCTNGALK